MKPETLKALKLSIEKWAGIAAGKTLDLGTHNCALCMRFNSKNTCVASDGERCPVAERAQRTCCVGTPYDDWLEADGFIQTADTPASKVAARAELKFLKSLLPKPRRVKSGA